ncbi:MAG: hypothetical protein KZQ83_07375, partial [gamma proteobacterium symbiont of Taylorina sp.]|nr:hypothetical protein [gamma proteobacterium symbiont of Taylorina sp.]
LNIKFIAIFLCYKNISKAIPINLLAEGSLLNIKFIAIFLCYKNISKAIPINLLAEGSLFRM